MPTPKEIAATLREAMSADVWYDAACHNDSAAFKVIERIQTAMTAAADLLYPADKEAAGVAAIYRQAAKRKHHREGEIEVDDGAKVSLGDDAGAYVQAWIWVSESDAGIVTDEASEIICTTCADKTDTEKSPDGERCPDCYDKFEAL